jgi:hypothetical protein
VPLALGIVPVGMAAASFGDGDGDGLLPWVAERLKELEAEPPPLFDEGDGIDFEAVAGTDPDIILAAYSGLSRFDYKPVHQTTFFHAACRLIRGQLETIGDGVAMISGLANVRLDEVLRFQGGQVGFARVLDRDLIGCVLLDSATDVEAGEAVFGTGEVVEVPVGETLFGRIVDPLGRPLDGKGAIEAIKRLPIERPAPSIIERETISHSAGNSLLQPNLDQSAPRHPCLV